VLTYTVAPTSQQVMYSRILGIQLNCPVYMCLYNKPHLTVTIEAKFSHNSTFNMSKSQLAYSKLTFARNVCW